MSAVVVQDAMYDPGSDPQSARLECICARLSRRQGVSLPELSGRIVDRTLDIANRLRFACAHMHESELLDLAHRMAVIEVKYASAPARADVPPCS